MDDFYILIDGGGTKTELLLCRADGRVERRLTVGATNPNDIGIGAACEILRSATIELAENAACAPSAVAAGIAGATGHSVELSAALCDIAARVSVQTDAMLLLNQAGAGDAACLISGTGSICYLRRGGEIYRIGGWGYLLDGGGSGYDIGRDAVAAVLRAHDGREMPTCLTQKLAAALGAEVCNAIPAIYGGGKKLIASLAPAVFEAAEEGDAVAQNILLRCAESLASLTRRASELLGNGRCRAAVGGSLLARRDDMFRMVCERTPGNIELIRTGMPNIWGAFCVAANGRVPQNAEQNFIETYKEVCK